MDIKKKYSSKEEFIKKYKKCQCNYDFGNDVFCGFRGIIISKKDMNEYQKLQYVLAINDKEEKFTKKNIMCIQNLI